MNETLSTPRTSPDIASAFAVEARNSERGRRTGKRINGSPPARACGRTRHRCANGRRRHDAVRLAGGVDKGVKEVSIVAAVGVGVGLVVVSVVAFSDRRRWLSNDWAMIVPLATVVVAYATTVELHGSGFIGAFVAGLVYGRGLGPRAHHTVGLVEDLGQALSAATFLPFGAVMIGPALSRIDAQTAVYAVLSLTIVRMIPVALSLIGTGTSPRSMAFAGRFGPRGLATIVFALRLRRGPGAVGG